MNNVIQKLQQRIDKRSNDIAKLEQYIKNPDEAWMADGLDWYREDQTLDKRLMGMLMHQQRLLEVYLHHEEF